MTMVVICNILQVICYLFAVRKQDFSPLVTLGDAIASFLHRPSKNSYLLGPISAAYLEVLNDSEVLPSTMNEQQSRAIEDGILPFVNPERMDAILKLLTDEACNRFMERPRWFTGASSQRWTVTYMMFVFEMLRRRCLVTHLWQMLIRLDFKHGLVPIHLQVRSSWGLI